MWLLFQCTIMVGVSWTGIYYEWTPNKAALGIVMVNANGSGTSGLFNRNNGSVTDGGPTVTDQPVVTDGNGRYGSGVTVENSQNSLGPNGCYVVTDEKGGGGTCIQCGG